MSKVVLCGYNWAGCKALKVLKSMYDEVYVYTHESPYHTCDLKKYSRKCGLSVTTDKINSRNLPFTPDLLVSVYYREIINKEVLGRVKTAAINLHPSLLPDYKGCSSLTWAMVNGEKYAGYTYHYMEESIDSGNIIVQEPIEIEDFELQENIYNRVMFESLKKLPEAVKMAESGFEGHEQGEASVGYKSRGAPHDGQIKDEWSHEKKERFIRAMIYPPLPPASMDGKNIKTIDELEEK